MIINQIYYDKILSYFIELNLKFKFDLNYYIVKRTTPLELTELVLYTTKNNKSKKLILIF